MHHLVLVLSAMTLGAATVFARPAHALGCPQQRLQDQVRAADVIFSGRALDMSEELTTTFEVDRVYKGQVAARVVVETGRIKYAMLSPPDRYLSWRS